MYGCSRLRVLSATETPLQTGGVHVWASPAQPNLPGWLLVRGDDLTAGMVVSAEIKTGKRQVMDYFLSPLIGYSTEALREN
jgi:hypothetical protein